jgi:pentatricopeptide repeat protein
MEEECQMIHLYQRLLIPLLKKGMRVEDVFKRLLFKFKIVSNTKISVSLIEKLIKAKKLTTAYYLFRVLRNEGVVLNLAVYNSLLTAAGEAGNFSFACPIFKDLLANGSPDSMSYFALSRAFAKVGDTGVAYNFSRELLESSLCNTTVLNRLIYAFAETGQTKSALGLFEFMKHWKCKPDLVTYNTIIYILGKEGQADAAFHEFLTMKDLGHVPDIITYNTLINNFSRFGRLDLCLMLFQEMVGRGIEPDLRTYTV